MAFLGSIEVHRTALANECWIGEEDHGGFVIMAQMSGHTMDATYDFFVLYSQLKAKFAVLPALAYRRGFYTSDSEWFNTLDQALRRYEDAEEGPISQPLWRDIKQTFVREHEQLANHGYDEDDDGF